MEEGSEGEADGGGQREPAKVGRLEVELCDGEARSGQSLRERVRREVEEVLRDVQTFEPGGEVAPESR